MTRIAVFAATGDLYAATDFGLLRLSACATHWLVPARGLPRAAGMRHPALADVCAVRGHPRSQRLPTRPTALNGADGATADPKARERGSADLSPSCDGLPCG